ncbi:hypothetical protein FIU90_12200 [Erythrobacter sp. THAF29]|nr:hypothetical protein FIU90_12200 [Erythrobacter sp. THAF29]
MLAVSLLPPLHARLRLTMLQPKPTPPQSPIAPLPVVLPKAAPLKVAPQKAALLKVAPQRAALQKVARLKAAPLQIAVPHKLSAYA